MPRGRAPNGRAPSPPRRRTAGVAVEKPPEPHVNERGSGWESSRKLRGNRSLPVPGRGRPGRPRGDGPLRRRKNGLPCKARMNASGYAVERFDNRGRYLFCASFRSPNLDPPVSFSYHPGAAPPSAAAAGVHLRPSHERRSHVRPPRLSSASGLSASSASFVERDFPGRHLSTRASVDQRPSPRWARSVRPRGPRDQRARAAPTDRDFRHLPAARISCRLTA